MKFAAVALAAAALAQSAHATITYVLAKEDNPTDDQADAYARIEDAMNAAIDEWNRFPNVDKSLYVTYDTGVPTADGNYNGSIRFGSNRSYMQKGTALHEIAHTLGVGQTDAWNNLCATGTWYNALAVLRSFDGDDANLNCGGGHFWPYGLNYDNEYNDDAYYRNVAIVEGMLRDGM